MDQNNGNGDVEVSVDHHKEESPHRENHQVSKEVPNNSRPLAEGSGKDNSERESGELPDGGAVHKSRSVETGVAPIGQSPKDLKLLRDKVKAKREKAKKLLGERTRRNDLMDEDDLIERELEDVELAVGDEKAKQKNVDNSDLMGTEHGGVKNAEEEGEMVNDVSQMMHSRKRKMGSPQSEGKRRHSSENGEESHKSNRGSSSSSHHGDREHRRHSQERYHS